MRHLWFLENRKGQALVEYVLLVALVATCLVAILGLTRNAARGAYARTSVKVAPVAPAGFGVGSGSSGGSWRPVGHDGGPKPEADSTGEGDSADSAATAAGGR
jgi:Flp pilus assembly pilin Flp